MDPQLMRLRCDHCRRDRGLGTQRYWRMQFCSAACKKAYQQRLREHTKVKISQLDCAARDPLPKIRRVSGSSTLAGFGRPFAG